MQHRKFYIFPVLLFFSLFSLVAPVFAEVKTYDVVIVGAGSGGCSAAIQAARMGMSVALVEPSDWVGGQMTGAAVSTMDDKRMTRTGIYGEFINKARNYYAALGRNVNVCYWGNDTIAFEPRVGQKLLLSMLQEAGKVDVIRETSPVSVTKNDDRVVSAVFVTGGAEVTFRAKVFIDATECGDFIPLTGARYRSGNSLFPNMKPHSIIQDITYVAVIKKYPEGLPPTLKVTTPPPRYHEYLFGFRSVIRPDGSSWPGSYPFDVPTHNAYRAMPDPANNAVILGGESWSWGDISKTAINWANDYPGEDYPIRPDKVSRSMSIDFLENPNFRAEATREAMLKTLCFIYYMQNELGMHDWSVDSGQGYGNWFVSDWRQWGSVLEPYAGIISHFPPFPYVRESRRLVGVRTMTISDIRRDQTIKRTLVNERDAVALGEYPTDIHGKSDNEYLEEDLGETKDKLPNDWEGDGGLFQIPLGVFIPEKIDGLLAAEKNISVSRVVNGSTRLQPVTMLTGQAAGAIAALAVKRNIQPRDVQVFDVQRELIKSRTRLSLHIFEDAPEYSPLWPGIEAAVLYEYMEPYSERLFGTYKKMRWADVGAVFENALGVSELPSRNAFETVSENELAQWLAELYGKNIDWYRSVTDKLVSGRDLSKGKLAQTVYEIMVTDKEAEHFRGKSGKK